MMMNVSNLKKIAAAVLLMCCFANGVSAQCAMCKQNVEAATRNPDAKKVVGSGLNEGILFLLSFPYLTAAVVGVLWYRHRRKLLAGEGEV